MWTLIKWAFYALLAVAGVYLAIGIGTILAVIGAALSSMAIGGGVLLVIILMVKEAFEGTNKPPS